MNTHEHQKMALRFITVLLADKSTLKSKQLAIDGIMSTAKALDSVMVEVQAIKDICDDDDTIADSNARTSEYYRTNPPTNPFEPAQE